MIPAEGTIEPKVVMPTTLGDRIKAVRMAWGWAQEEVAEILRVDQASISFWERDKIKPSGSAMVALAALFRTTLDGLERGENFVVPTYPSSSEGGKKTRPVPRCVCLPATDRDKVTIVDLVNGGLSSPQLSDAMMALGQSSKDNRKIWIVVE
jgi:transcriptional regulator with XRE-family HTH domain